MLITLQVLGYGASEPAELQFEGESITIGRGRANDLTLPDQKVSKKHAKIEVSDDGCLLIDLESKNGTYVDGEGINGGPHLLENGERIGIGDFIIVFSQSLHQVWQSPTTTELKADDPEGFRRPVVQLVQAIKYLIVTYERASEEERDTALKDALEDIQDTELDSHPVIQHVLEAFDSSECAYSKKWSFF